MNAFDPIGTHPCKQQEATSNVKFAQHFYAWQQVKIEL